MNSDFLDKYSMRAGFAELLATFMFVFVGVGAIGAFGEINGINGPQLLFIAIAHGLGIAVGILAIGRISGAHINPAVTIAALIAGRIGLVNAAVYIVAQLAGAILAIVALDGSAYQSDSLGVHAVAGGLSLGNAFVLEVILTFFLVFIIFATAMEKRANAVLAPLAIGGFVAMGHFVAIPLTGASMNPARSFGPALVHGSWADHWLYWVAPIIGAVIAAIVYIIVFGTVRDRQRAGAIAMTNDDLEDDEG